MAEWTDEYNVNDLGLQVGQINALNSAKGRKRKHPLGFAAPTRKPRKQAGVRAPGSFPDVPRFDIREGATVGRYR